MPPYYAISHKDKFLRRLYEPLVLLSVLDPSRDAIKPDLISDRGLNEQAKLWRNFLDQSSFLCDAIKGGDTVTAIATQKTYEQPIFWLASNSNSCDKAREHYQWILSCLERLCKGSMTDDESEKEIFGRCISFSSKRIKTYVNWLDNAIDKAKRQKQGQMTPEDDQLFEMLQGIKSRSHDYRNLCTYAHACRLDESILVLSRRHNAHDHRNVWSDIRHLVGRLGMWTKAVKILIRGARRFPHYIENATVKTVSPDMKADVPNVGHLTDLAGLIHRVLPSSSETNIAEMLRKALTDMDYVGGIWKRFRHTYESISPRPHAELIVLEQFHRSEFEFLNDDRYIGCSKPSCYCCYLYIQCHPGRFTPRPCHGNLYLNWAPPIALPSGGIGGAKAKTGLRLQDHHSFKVLQQMLVSIRQDLQEQILSRRPRRQKLPDSTTGMSSIAALIQAINEGPATSLHTMESLVSSSSKPTSSEVSFSDENDNQLSVVLNDDTQLISNSTKVVSLRKGSNVSSDGDADNDDDDDDILVFKGRQLQTSQ